MPETMTLPGSTKNKITKDENGVSFRNYWISIVHCNIANIDYKQDSIVLYTFISNKSFGQLLDISLKKNLFPESFDSEFSYIEVWFTD